jgi:hypothetical protein
MESRTTSVDVSIELQRYRRRIPSKFGSDCTSDFLGFGVHVSPDMVTCVASVVARRTRDCKREEEAASQRRAVKKSVVAAGMVSVGGSGNT